MFSRYDLISLSRSFLVISRSFLVITRSFPDLISLSWDLISLSRDLISLSRDLFSLSLDPSPILSRYLEILSRYLEILSRYMEIKPHKIGKSHVVFLSNTRGSYTITTMNRDRVELISVYHSRGWYTDGFWWFLREIVMFLAQKHGYILSERHLRRILKQQGLFPTQKNDREIIHVASFIWCDWKLLPKHRVPFFVVHIELCFALWRPVFNIQMSEIQDPGCCFHTFSIPLLGRNRAPFHYKTHRFLDTDDHNCPGLRKLPAPIQNAPFRSIRRTIFELFTFELFS